MNAKPWKNRAAFAAGGGYSDRRRAGVALMLTLIALTMAFILALGFLAAQSTSVGLARNVDRLAVARGIAETGLNDAIQAVSNDNSWRTDFTNGTWVNAQVFSGGTLTVLGQDGVYNASTGTVVGTGNLNSSPTDPLTITSTGTYGGVNYTVRGLVTTSVYNSACLLFVVPNPASLSADDTARQNYFTAQNWTVTTIADNATQAQLNSAISGNNVIYISANASASNLGTKLKTASIGIVTEQPGMAVQLGLVSATATNTYAASTTYIASNTQYITQSFSTGSMAICSSSQSLTYYSGTLASGALVLARQPTTTYGTLIIIPAGGTLIDSSQCQARRVFLPWGGSGFVFSSLNASGQTILAQSLQWAAGAGGTSTMGNPGVAVTTTIVLKSSTTIDSFDSSQGAYGGANVAANAVIATNGTTNNRIKINSGTTVSGSAFCGPGGNASSVIDIAGSGTLTGIASVLSSPVLIPSNSAPTGMPTSSGNVTYSSGTTTWSSNQQFGTLTLSNAAIVQVSGNISVLCNSTFAMKNTSQLNILPNSSLKLYCMKGCALSTSAQANTNTGNPTKLLLFMLGTTRIGLTNASQMYATALAPTSQLYLAGTAQFYGTYFGKSVSLNASSALHQDTNGNGATVLTGGGAVATSTVYNVNALWCEQAE